MMILSCDGLKMTQNLTQFAKGSCQTNANTHRIAGTA